LLRNRGYEKDNKTSSEGYIDFDHKEKGGGIRFKESMFDDKGNLRVITPEQWQEDNVSTYAPDPPAPPDDDDVPF
jgi:hypothetical protein